MRKDTRRALSNDLANSVSSTTSDPTKYYYNNNLLQDIKGLYI